VTLAALHLPAGALSLDPAARSRAATDRSGWRPETVPDAVVHARTVDDVIATLRWATANRVPVVPRGAGSGLSGGAVASAGSVVLDLSGLDSILEIRPDEQLARVQPGVVTAELDRAAGEFGLRYTPDPASAAISTIGGNIATNAGGLHCVKYGVTRDAVLGLDVVLADGTLLHTGRSTVKGVVGFDVTALLTGSEGTLGVIVGATLKLQPLPAHTATATASFASVEEAVAAVGTITRLGVRPSVLEFLDGATLRAIDDAQGSALRAHGEALLLVQTDGLAADAEIALITDALGSTATRVEVAGEGGADLLAARRAALPAIERLGRVLIEDIAVPLPRLADAVRAISDLSARTGVQVFCFAHAGDGNLHPIIVAPPGTDIPAHVQAVADEIFRLALDLGGTVSGEHGVGLLKRTWLAAELGDEQLALQRRIKAAFDPLSLLNPGKAL
jgi:glycolate oxidase